MTSRGGERSGGGGGPDKAGWEREPRRGPLMGIPQCCVSISSNGNVPCPCHLFSPMSHVEFKKCLCHMPL